MNVLVFSLALFLCGFAVHWLLWRVRVPPRATVALLLVFGAVLAAGLAAAGLPAFARWAPRGLWERIHVAVFYVPAALAYIVLYSGLELDSPSFTMVKFVSLAGPAGRAPREFEGLITDDLVVESRLRAMVEGGLAVHDGDAYRLTARGRFWERVFGLWTRLLGLPEPG